MPDRRRFARDRYPMLTFATATIRVAGYGIAAVGGLAALGFAATADQPVFGALGLLAAVGAGSVIAAVGTLLDLVADIADHTRVGAEEAHRANKRPSY